MPAKAAETVLQCSELVEKIVTHLTRWEAIAVQPFRMPAYSSSAASPHSFYSTCFVHGKFPSQLSQYQVTGREAMRRNVAVDQITFSPSQLLTTSKSISAAAGDCLKRGDCRPRMVLTSSRNNMLVEINPLNGRPLRSSRFHPQVVSRTLKLTLPAAFGSPKATLTGYDCIPLLKNYSMKLGVEHWQACWLNTTFQPDGVPFGSCTQGGSIQGGSRYHVHAQCC